MEASFNVDLNELRGHAATVGDVAGQVRSAGTGAQDSVSGAYGSIAEFFASSVTSSADVLRGAIGEAGDTVDDVRVGLRETADSYQKIDDHYVTVFGVGDSGSGGQQFAQAVQEKIPDVGSVGGRYGDDRTGPAGTAQDVADLAMAPSPAARVNNLAQVEYGGIVPDPDSRLGAFAGTRGYDQGTVGHAVHWGIAAIYMSLGDAGQENIGRVFNSPEAKALYTQPVDSPANLEMARIEYNYWSNVRTEDPWSMGANIAVQVSPEMRAEIQRQLSVLPAPPHSTPPLVAPPVRVTPP